MIDPLVTTEELDRKSRGQRPLVVRVIGTALGAGILAFLLTWLVLAWPTVTATVRWSLHHPNRLGPAKQTVQTISAVPAVPDNHLVIPLIGVSAPIIYDTAITDAVGKLPEGVVHVRGTAEPGGVGNVFILGHSSGYWWQSGSYTQVFVLLDKLTVGDDVFVNRAGETFHYKVTSREVVRPTAIDELTQPNNRHELSIMTCTPIGTSLNRLIVHADLVARSN